MMKFLVAVQQRADRDVTPARRKAGTRGLSPGWLPLLVLSAAAGLDAGGIAVLNSALPAIGQRFGVSAGELSWAVTGYALAFAGLLLAGGAIADRRRRRMVLVCGLMMVAAGGSLAMVAQAFWMIVVGRVLQGAGAAMTIPAATALLTATYTGSARMRALGVFSAAQATSFGLGLVSGGVITSLFGWRWVFVAQVLATVLIAVAALRRLPTTRVAKKSDLDPTAVAALSVAIVLLVLAVDSLPWADWWTVALLLVGAGAGWLWWRRSHVIRAESLPLDPALLAISSVRVAALVAAAFYFCVTGPLFLLPLMLQQLGALSPAQSGLVMLPVSLAVSAAAVLSGRLMKTRGPRVPLLLGIALTVVGVGLWCFTGTSGLSIVLGGLVVTGFGQGLAYPAIIATGLRDVAEVGHGTASAVTVTALQIGSGIGPALLACVAQWVSSGFAELTPAAYRVAFAVAAGVLLLCGLVALAWRPMNRPPVSVAMEKSPPVAM